MDRDEMLQKLKEALTAKNSSDLARYTKMLLDLEPSNMRAYHYLAEACLIDSNYDEAERYLEKVLSVNSNDFMVKHKLGRTKIKNKKREEGLKIYKELLVTNPKSADLHHDLGVFYIDERLLQKATTHFVTAIQINENYLDAYQGLATVLQHLGCYQQALGCLEKVIQKAPNNPNWYQTRISINKHLKDVEACERDYEQVLFLEQQDETSIRVDFAEFYASLGQNRQAEKQYTIVIDSLKEKGERNLNYHKRRGEIRLRTSDYTGATADFSIALEMAPKSAELHHLRSKAHRLEGNKGAALVDLLVGIDLGSKIKIQLGEMHEWAGRILMDLGCWDEAKVQFEALCQLPAGRGLGLHLLALLYYKRGEQKAAYKSWRLAYSHGYLRANEMIKKYIQEAVKKKEVRTGINLEKKINSEYAHNGASPFLKKLFGRYWSLDKEATVAESPSLQSMPEFLKKSIFAIVENLAFTISPKDLILISPLKTDMRICYEILEETPEGIRLTGKKVNPKSKKAITLDLSFKEECLRVVGLIEGVTKEVFYFKKVNFNKISDQSVEEITNHLVSIARTFINDVLNKIIEKLKKKK